VTHSFEVASENHSYLLLYTRWPWNDNHFYVRGESSITALKVLEATVKKFSRPGDSMSGACLLLFLNSWVEIKGNNCIQVFYEAVASCLFGL
jgi:hypothetical protein